MHITLLVDRYLPSPLSSAKMFHDLATELSRLENHVTVVTSDDSISARLEVYKEGNITILRVKSGTIRHPSKIIRAINEIRLSGLIWNSARRYFKTHPCDLVICYSPTIFWSGLIKKLKVLNRCGVYLVLRDIFPQWALDTGLLSKYGLVYWFFRYQEIRLYKSVDVIGVQSPANLDYFLTSSLLRRYSLEVLYNWTKIEVHTNKFSSLRFNYKLQDKVIFVYGGNLGIAQDIDNILRLANNLKHEKKIFFLLVGNGSEFENIKFKIEHNSLTNVMLLPVVSHSEFKKILVECDVGLITLRRDFKTHNIPGKMLSYMELCKPILASVNPGNDLIDIIHGYNYGFACINGDDHVFCQHALNLAYDQNLRLHMGINARRLLKEKFNVTFAAQKILDHFSKKIQHTTKSK